MKKYLTDCRTWLLCTPLISAGRQINWRGPLEASHLNDGVAISTPANVAGTRRYRPREIKFVCKFELPYLPFADSYFEIVMVFQCLPLFIKRKTVA